jgi:hypothetical protein
MDGAKYIGDWKEDK